jgi:tetratricopeptide (TPR) repeat protein
MAALTLKDAYLQARAHYEAGRIADAEQLCAAILRKVPNAHDTLLILGAIRVRQGRHHDALKAFDRACKALPSSADAWSNRGSVLRSLGRFAKALASYDRAIKLDPGAIAAHYNRGNVLRVLGRQDEALTCFERAIALNPGHASAHYNAGLTLLQSGDYHRGFAEFEWRWKALNATPRNEPLWLGDDISGKAILLHAEQGLGDALQFVRFVPMVAAREATVILEVRPPLKTLLANTPGAPSLRGASRCRRSIFNAR